MNGNHRASLALAAHILWLGACASAQSPQQQPPEDNAKPGAQVLHSNAPTARVTGGVRTGDDITSDEDVVVITHPEPIKSEKREFQVLFGALCDKDGQLCAGAADCDCKPGVGAFRNTDPEWHIKNGYALIRGFRPRVRTSRSTAAAEGTDFFVQIDKSGGNEVHRFALIEGGPLKLYEIANNVPGHPDNLTLLSPKTILKYAQTYATVTLDASGKVVIGPPESFPPTDDGTPGAALRKLILEVQAKDLAKATE